MGERIVHVPVQGTWSRHVRAGEGGLAAGRGGRGGRFHRAGQLAVYLAAAGVPQRLRPTRSQWAAFQQRADHLRAEGAHGVLYGSAARTRSLCLCVFEAGLAGLRVDGEPVRVLAPPPPPRGLRT